MKMTNLLSCFKKEFDIPFSDIRKESCKIHEIGVTRQDNPYARLRHASDKNYMSKNYRVASPMMGRRLRVSLVLIAGLLWSMFVRVRGIESISPTLLFLWSPWKIGWKLFWITLILIIHKNDIIVDLSMTIFKSLNFIRFHHFLCIA